MLQPQFGEISSLDAKLQKVLLTSRSVLDKAYCPYSNFPVGAALLCENGEIYTGVNVENACNNLGICAERTAVVKAVSEGNTKFAAVAISGKASQDFVMPCGACRQVLSEFGMDCQVYVVKPDLSYMMMPIKDLLPYEFGRKDLRM